MILSSPIMSRRFIVRNITLYLVIALCFVGHILFASQSVRNWKEKTLNMAQQGLGFCHLLKSSSLHGRSACCGTRSGCLFSTEPSGTVIRFCRCNFARSHFLGEDVWLVDSCPIVSFLTDGLSLLAWWNITSLQINVMLCWLNLEWNISYYF